MISAHNRSSFTSTSVSITRQIFRDFTHKNLPIPAAINVYNHYMSGVDIANQCQAAFTTLRGQNTRYWKPLFHWLLDIALVNSYLLARATNRVVMGKSKHCRDHRRF